MGKHAQPTTGSMVSERTKEDTSKGGEGAQKVGLPGDRRLSHVDVGGGSQSLGVGFLVQLIGVVHDGGKAQRVRCV
jgi:hypothetical protein